MNHLKIKDKNVTYKLTWVCIWAGIFLRLRHYLENRSLWLDEAFVGINVAQGTYSEFFNGLFFWQEQSKSPLGFMVVEKYITSLWGLSEFTLRFYPQCVSLISIFLFYKLAQQFFKKEYLLLCVALFCFCDAIIYYSAELKPYSSDVFCGLLMYYFIFSVRDFPRKYFYLALLGIFSICFSFTSLFIVPIIGLVFWVTHLRNKEWKKFIFVTFMNVTWIAFFYIQYMLLFKTMVSNEVLISQWRGVFPQLDFGFSDYIFLIPKYLTDFCAYPGGFVLPVFVAALYVLGISVFLKKDIKSGVVLFGPMLLCVLFSLAGKYPFSSRLILFLTPALFIALTAAVQYLSVKLKKERIIFYLLFIFLCAPVISTSVIKAINGYEFSPVRGLMKKFVVNWQPEHMVLLNNSSKFQYLYYIQQFKKEDQFFYSSLERFGGNGYKGNPVIEVYDQLIEIDQKVHVGFYNYIFKRKNGRISKIGLKTKGVYYLDITQPEKLKSLFSGNKVWVLFFHTRDDLQSAIKDTFLTQAGILKEYHSNNSSIYLIEFN